MLGWAVGVAGTIIKTTDGGTSWNEQTSGTTVFLESVYFVDIQTGWVVGSNGTILKTTTGGGITEVEDMEQKNPAVPEYHILYQNYPNPFNPITTINYSIPITSHVTISIYDILGTEIIKIVNEEKRPGNYKIKFDGSNLSSGVYLYRMSAGDFWDTRKLILLK